MLEGTTTTKGWRLRKLAVKGCKERVLLPVVGLPRSLLTAYHFVGLVLMWVQMISKGLHHSTVLYNITYHNYGIVRLARYCVPDYGMNVY